MSNDFAVDSVEPLVTLHVGFLLMPEYTLSTFSNAVGMLRMANRLSGRELYRWSTYSLDGEPVVSSAGLEVKLDGSLKKATEVNILLACGGYNIKDYCTKPLLDSLRAIVRRTLPREGASRRLPLLPSSVAIAGCALTVRRSCRARPRHRFRLLRVRKRVRRRCPR